MAASFNSVVVMGNLTRDPEMFGKKTSVASLGLAINSTYNGEEKTVFLDCKAFGKTAEFCEKYLRKGSPVLIGGRLETESFETKRGQKVNKLVVIATTVQSVGGKQGDGDRDEDDGDDRRERRGRRDDGDDRGERRSRDDGDDRRERRGSDDDERRGSRSRRDDDEGDRRGGSDEGDPDWRV